MIEYVNYERRRLIVNSVWLEIFVVRFFDWSSFGKYRFRLVRWKCRVFFVKISKNKSGMPPEFCLFVIGGKEMLLYLIGHGEESQDLFLCL